MRDRVRAYLGTSSEKSEGVFDESDDKFCESFFDEKEDDEENWEGHAWVCVANAVGD